MTKIKALIIISTLLLSTQAFSNALPGTRVQCNFEQIHRDLNSTHITSSPGSFGRSGSSDLNIGDVVGEVQEYLVVSKNSIVDLTSYSPQNNAARQNHCQKICKSQAISLSRRLPQGVAVKVLNVPLCEEHNPPSGTGMLTLLRAGLNPVFNIKTIMDSNVEKEYNEDTGHGSWTNSMVKFPSIASANTEPVKALPEFFNEVRWQNVNMTDDLEAIMATLERVAPGLVVGAVIVTGGYKIAELIATRGRSIASPAAYYVAVAFIVSQIDHMGLWDELTSEEQYRFSKYL